MFESQMRDAVSNANLLGCRAVIGLVAKHKKVPIRLILHQSRSMARAARARQLAMYLSHVILGKTLVEIGVAFGRDRTTVSHACALIEDLRDNPAFDAEVCQLEAVLEGEAGHAQ
jgi:chromosomal replication initiation ATPase DnaA